MPHLKSMTLLFCASLCLASPGWAQPSCTDCGPTGGKGFGYPVVSGHSGGWGNQHNLRKERREAWKEEADKIYRRNDAWPKPFDCLDRMAYHSIFDPMIHAGYETQCILGSQHFDPDTQQLNSFGQSTVAAIMQNMPSHRKNIFVAQTVDQRVTEMRMQNVNQLVSTFYGQLAPNATVSASTLEPAMISGSRAEGVLRRFTDSAPAPIVPLQTSGTSIERSQNR